MRTPLRDFCTFSSGGKLKLTKANYQPSGYPAISAAGQDGYVGVCEFSKPAIVISSIGARCGKAFLALGKWTSLANTYSVFPDLTIADPEFVWYQLNDESSWKRSGSAQPFIKPSDIQHREVYLPPLDEQRRIVDILGHAASIRRLREQAQAKAREIIPALFLDMFGDPATNPRGWRVGTVGDILSSAQYGTSTKASETTEGTPMLRMGNVTTDGALSLDDLKYVVLDGGENEKYSLRTGDILFNRTNSKDLVGKTGLWDGRFTAVHASYFIRLRVDERRVEPEFVWAFFNSAFMKKRLFETARGAIGQANINAKEVEAFSIPIPPIAFQKRFCDCVEDVKATIDIGVKASDAASALSQAMLNRCFGNTEKIS